MDLADETEQVLQDRLELLSPETGELADAGQGDAELRVLLRYCLQYDLDEHLLQRIEQRIAALRRQLVYAVTTFDSSAVIELPDEGEEPRD